MTLQPNTIENQLIEELSRYIREDKAPSELEVARLKREAAKLKNGSRAVYASIMGMIASLDNDLAECKKQHERAIFLDGSVQHYEAYCTSLYNLDCIRDAYNWAQKGLSVFPHAPSLISSALQSAYFLELFDKVIEHYQALIPLQLVCVESSVQDFVQSAEIVLSSGISEPTLHKLSDILHSIRVKHGAGIKRISLSLTPTEETQELLNWVETTSNVDTTVDMNMELCEMLASEPDIDLRNMTVAFRACQH